MSADAAPLAASGPAQRAGLRRGLRFLASGGASFLAEVGVFSLVFAASGAVAVANAAALICSALVNYTLQARWVFASGGRTRRTLSRYGVGLIGTYVVSTPLVALLVVVGMPGPVAKTVTSIALAPFAFLLGKHWIYAGR